jgi:hypothetical protein
VGEAATSWTGRDIWRTAVADILSVQAFEWVRLSGKQNHNDTLVLRTPGDHRPLGRYVQVVREGAGRMRRMMTAVFGADHRRTEMDLLADDDSVALRLTLRREKGYWIDIAAVDGSPCGQLLDAKGCLGLRGADGAVLGRIRRRQELLDDSHLNEWDILDAAGHPVGTIRNERGEGDGWGAWLTNAASEWTDSRSLRTLSSFTLELGPGVTDPLALVAKVAPVGICLLNSLGRPPFDLDDPAALALADPSPT